MHQNPPATKLLIIISTCFLLSWVSCNNASKSPFKSMDLNGVWQFKAISDEAWLPARVPGSVQFDLLNNQIISDPFWGNNEDSIQWIEEKNWAYTKDFILDSSWLDFQSIELDMDGLDTYADIYLNDKFLLSTDNMFKKWRLNCKNELKIGHNTLTIVFTSPINKHIQTLINDLITLPNGNENSEIKASAHSRKAPFQFGWDWGPRVVTMGIWKEIHLKAYNMLQVNDVYFNQKNISTERADIDLEINLNTLDIKSCTLKVILEEKTIVDQAISLNEGSNTIKVPFCIQHPRIWWPNGMGLAHLNNFRVQLSHKGQLIFDDTFKIGLRKIELIRDKDSIGTAFRFRINDKDFYAKGANYIPQDILLSRVSETDYNFLIEQTMASNMNMLRVWGGGIYEKELFYQLCDEKGILVWQDFMFACNMYPPNDSFLSNATKEAAFQVQRLRNHACISLWCGNNEVEVAWKNWGWQKQFNYSSKDSILLMEYYKKLFQNNIPTLIKSKTNVPYISSSPLSNWGKKENFNHHNMHYWGVWHGREPFENFSSNVGRFMSEYGFQSFPEMKTIASFSNPKAWNLDHEIMQNRQKSYIGNGLILQHIEQYYPKPKDFVAFVYLSQLTQAKAMDIALEAHRIDPKCAGTLYWQLNDCWPGPSWSGIDYYGNWKAMQYVVRDKFSEQLICHSITDQQCSIDVFSEKTEDSVLVECTLYDFKGNKKENAEFFGALQKGMNKNLILLNTNKIAKKERSNHCILCQLNNKENAIEKFIYFRDEKQLKLQKMQLSTQLIHENGKYELILESKHLIKNLQVIVPGKVTLSDNYFDLLPGRAKHLSIRSDQKISQDMIKYYCLNELHSEN